MNGQNRFARWAAAVEHEALPVAVLDKTALDHNLAELSRLSWGKPVRVVTKSLRCPDVIEYVVRQLGTQCAGLMAYHPLEAVMLSECFPGVSVLVAYPCQDRQVLERVAAKLVAGQAITLMVDAPEQLALLAQVADRHDVEVPVCVDVDMSSRWPGLHFGVHRSPLRSTEQVLHLVREIHRTGRLRFAGVMGYEAQIAGVPDTLPGDALHNLVVPSLKKRSGRHVRNFRANVVAALRQAGFSPSLVNGGGTGSVNFTACCPEVTEVAVGSGFFCPHLFDGYASLDVRPAAGFACRVERRSDKRHVTVGGGGYVASGAPGISRLPKPIWPNGLQLDAREGAGEVQTPLRGTGAASLEIGDVVVFRHAKAGELCERFNELLWIEDEKVQRRSLTYRGLGWQFM